MTTISELGVLLKAHRKKQGLTLSALAEKSHIHRNTLSALEHGVGNVELNTLLALCEQLGLELVLAPKAIAPFVRPKTTPSASLQTSAGRKLSAARARQESKIQETEQEPETTALQKRIAARLASAGFDRNKGPK